MKSNAPFSKRHFVSEHESQSFKLLNGLVATASAFLMVGGGGGGSDCSHFYFTLDNEF